MSHLRNKIVQNYSSVVELLFLCFVFFTLSFGRAFSVLHLDTPLAPLYASEFILLICTPLWVRGTKEILGLQNKFILPLMAYFFIGCFYLFIGIMNGNLFALRDIVLCGYILFLPLSFFVFSTATKLKLLLKLLFLANIVGLIVGRFYYFKIYPFELFENFIIRIKPFNLGLYYGLASSFLISFYFISKPKIINLFILVLLALNLYMSLIFANRTLWISFISLFIFFSLVYKKRFMKIIFVLIPVFIIVSSFLYYIDFKLIETGQTKFILAKIKSMKVLLVPNSRPGDLSIQIIKKSSFVPAKVLSIPAAKRPTFFYLTTDYKQSIDNIFWRLDIWRQAINFGLKSPLWGNGFGKYPPYKVWGTKAALPDTFSADSGIIPTHNHLVSIFYKMGVIGLGLFFFINIYILYYGFQYLRMCRSEWIKSFLTALLGSFVFWHTMALLFDMIDSPPTSIFLWIIIGLIFAVIKVDQHYVRSK